MRKLPCVSTYMDINTCINMCIYIRHRALVAREECLMPCMVPEIPGFCSFKGPTPESGAYLGVTFFEAIFRCFFNFVLWSMFDRFWRQLGPNLPPKLDPKSTKILSKRVPNPMPTCIMSSMPSAIDFGSLLSGFLVDFWCQVEGQVDQKSIISFLLGKLGEIVEKH